MNRVFVLVDFENLLINSLSMRDFRTVALPVEKRPTVARALERMKKWAESIGDICALYIFSPHHAALGYERVFYRFEAVHINCPKIPFEELDPEEVKILKQKGKENKDTADETLIKMGMLLMTIPGTTHIIIGSGDHGYEKMLRQAKKRGIKIGAIMAEDGTSHSRVILDLLDTYPETNEKMLHIFSSTDAAG